MIFFGLLDLFYDYPLDFGSIIHPQFFFLCMGYFDSVIDIYQILFAMQWNSTTLWHTIPNFTRGKRLIAQKLAKNVPLDAIFNVLATWQLKNIFFFASKRNATQKIMDRGVGAGWAGWARAHPFLFAFPSLKKNICPLTIY